MSVVVFVYGTLKRGKSNNILMRGSEYLGIGMTQEKYVMYEAGIPYVSDKFKLTNIVGELYKVDRHTLKALDNLEGHPIWYKRKEIEVDFLEDHIAKFNKENIKPITAWLYFNDDAPVNAEVNETGIYQAKRSQINSLMN
tara:strand:+ start:9438 stop:9857 length:420 start_codon:yes stop_codon:yes gene_type:complete